MLRYLLPSAAIVALCLAIYATSLDVAPVDNEWTVVPIVPVVPEPQPIATPPKQVEPTAPVTRARNEWPFVPIAPEPVGATT